MKKIILFILLFCATKSFAQFPINAAQGTQTTTVLTRGISASDSGYWYRTAFADTTALNRGRIDEIAGVVARTSDNSLWLRNNTATRWIQLSGGSGSVNIYNSDGTQTGNRIVTGGGYTLAFDAQSSIRLQPSGSNRTSLLYMDIDSIRLEPPFGILTIDSLASGASTDSVLVWTQATGRVKKRAATSIGTNPPISSLTAATQTNSINNGNFEQTWAWNSLNGGTGLTLSSNSTAVSTEDALFYVSTTGVNAASGITSTAVNILNSHSGTTSRNVALRLESNGGSSGNYALITSGGNVGIGTSTPTSLAHINGVLQMGTAGSTLGQILMSGNTSGTVTLQPAAAAGTWTLTLPDNDGDANQVLTTNGSGVTSWATASGGSPAGNFGNLQLNRNSAFATPASDSLDFESATGLSVKGDVRTTTSLYLPSSSSEGLRFGTTVRMYDNGSLMRISPTAGTMQMFTSGSNYNLQIYNSAGDSYISVTPLSGIGSALETLGSATNLKMQTTAANTLMIGNGTAVAKTNILSTTEQLRLMYDASNYVAHTVSSAGVYTVAPTGASVTVTKPVVLKNYTVATLPTGVQGMICYVTDATAPTYGATLVGGGAVVTMAFFDGTNWTAH